ncbi:two-component system histidine kinase PnpS [Geomicrobium sp. JSM 1781026]|uniref:two-component system histidine kinase PnpS n=1 Tax=Geomicrobium sp. JSM 1781026 TaxID=3344580 RepID=UPI0035BF78BB
MNTFRARLMFALLLIIVTVLTALGLLLGSLMNEMNMEQTVDRLQKETKLLALQINPLDEDQSLDVYIEEASKQLGARITVINDEGAVIAESHASYESSTVDYLQRPEIRNAGVDDTAEVRTSESVNEEMLYYAEPIGNGENVEGFVRMALNIEHIHEATGRVWLFIGISFSAALLIIMILGYRVGHQLTRPIYELTEMSKQLVKGNYKARAYDDSSDEIGQLARSVNLLALNLDKTTRRYEREHDRLRALIDHMGSGFIFINRHGIVSVANRIGREIFADGEEFEGLYYEIISDQTLVNFIQSVFMTEENKQDRLRLVTSPAKESYYEVYGTPIMSERSELEGVVIVLHDISDLKRLEQMRKDFVANVSHELKTPVTSLKGFAETLLDGSHEDPVIRKQFLEIIGKESSRLQDLIEDLLELSRIEHHTFQLHPSAFFLTEVISESLTLLHKKAEKKHIRLEERFHEEMEMVGDAARIKQLVINLVTNAIVYTPENGHVTVEAFRDEESHRCVIQVKDNGIGIDEQSLPRIFERFYRVDRARSRNSGGTGLGLAIVKHLVEAQQGTITAESTVNEGTTFTVRLPCSVTNENKPSSEE